MEKHNTAGDEHALCMLDTYGYKHTPSECILYSNNGYTNAPHCYVIVHCLSCFARSNPVMPHTYIHLNTALIRRTSGRSMASFQAMTLRISGSDGHFVWLYGRIMATNQYIYSPPVALWANAGHGLLILEVSRSHTTTRHSR